ncbi:Mediator of RNA polymerase II transcription subunit 1 domain containing protein [Naviculisporaceae sp. PSN 640]
MATPAAMKHALSQQGRTPAQSQHGAAATPPVSTPFSAAHAAFSPHGPRSSPQQVKKSPATSVTLGRSSNTAVNFDSPSAAAMFGALQAGSEMDLGIQGLGGLGSLARSTEDERAKRLDEVIDILGRSRGLVSRAGLERYANSRLGLDVLWENPTTLIIAGSTLALDVFFKDNKHDIVDKVTLSFPDSTEMVNKHAAEAGQILLQDLKLEPNQSPLTKSLEKFATNFERLAALDKLSINPGLNLLEAVAGIYESLDRLHSWEVQKLRADPSLAGRSDAYIESLVLCTKSGHPAMNARHKVGLGIDYWKQRRLQPPPTAELAEYVARTQQIWTLRIGCAPLQDLAFGPVRISDKWISPEVEKMPLPGEMESGPSIDWLEPENTFIPPPDQDKAGSAHPLNPGAPLLPEVTFKATFDPPLTVSSYTWQQIAQLGCGLPVVNHDQAKSYDMIIFPAPPNYTPNPGEPRVITYTKNVPFTPLGKVELSLKSHTNNLYIQKTVYGYTLTELTFSHPRQIVSMLPYIRQYAFLSTLLDNSFRKPGPSYAPATKPTTASNRTTTNNADFTGLMREGKSQAAVQVKTEDMMDTDTMLTDNNNNNTSEDKDKDSLQIDIELDFAPEAGDFSLNVRPAPRLKIMFEFRPGQTGVVWLDIRENGQVHVESQNVLDESNAVAPNGRVRRVEDIGRLLEQMEDIGKFAEFLRSRWA